MMEQYVAISPYHKEHYFVAFRDQSIKYNFKGAPKDWLALMTEVFNSWAAEQHAKHPVPFAQPYPQPNPYMQQQQQAMYPQGQPYSQVHPQQHPQVQAVYNYPSPAQLPAQLAANPSPSPGLPPGYTSPVAPNAVPNHPYGGYTGLPQGGAVEMLAELPGQTLVAGPTPVPVRSMSTDVSSSSFALLARDLWGADSKTEEEKLSV